MKKDYIPLTELTPGSIEQMLRQSYIGWNQFSKWEAAWKEYDRQVFTMPDTVGKSGRATLLDEIPVGFVSWDPRNYPEFVIIGHNCVLPQFRKKGIGKTQLKYALEYLMDIGFKKARVSTEITPFFLPARKMYASCGFKVRSAYRDDGPNTIYYEKYLRT